MWIIREGCPLHTHLVCCHVCLVMLCRKVEEQCLESRITAGPYSQNPFFIKSTFLHFPEILHLILHCPFYKRERFWVFHFNSMLIFQSERDSYSVLNFNYLRSPAGFKLVSDKSLKPPLQKWALIDVIFRAFFSSFIQNWTLER